MKEGVKCVIHNIKYSGNPKRGEGQFLGSSMARINRLSLVYIPVQYMLWNYRFKMLYLIGPDGLVNLSFENFQKKVWMTMIHVLRFRIKH